MGKDRVFRLRCQRYLIERLKGSERVKESGEVFKMAQNREEWRPSGEDGEDKNGMGNGVGFFSFINGERTGGRFYYNNYYYIIINYYC